MYHEPVLLKEAVEGLDIKTNGIYIDATYGGGGHSRAILEKLENGQLFAFDQDEDVIEQIVKNKQLIFIQQNFTHIKKFLRLNGITKVDGILADLGVSWHQINTKGRGFSFRFREDTLDMRMNQNAELTAQIILNSYKAEQLQQIFQQYGELPRAKSVAQAIVTARRVEAIETIEQFKKIVAPYVVGSVPKYWAKLFQALRIEVNDEMGVLKSFLTQSTDLLKENGRLVVIAYHSIEDRIVKNFMKKGSFDGHEEKDLFGRSEKPFTPFNKKVIVPSSSEVRQNPKSRSARLRIAFRNSSELT